MQVHDVKSVVKGLALTVKARGVRVCGNEGANAYMAGYLESMLVRVIEQLPVANRKLVIDDLLRAQRFEIDS